MSLLQLCMNTRTGQLLRRCKSVLFCCDFATVFSPDERKQTHFDTDIEKQQRSWNILLWQPSFEQCARKTESMQQTEDERDEPGSAQRETAMALSLSYQLYRQEKNTQYDGG